MVYLTGINKSDEFLKMYSLFRKEVTLFLTMFEGATIKVPKIKYLVKQLGYCRVYNFVRNKGFNEEAYEAASKFFGKRVHNIKAIVAKVEREMAKIRDNKVEFPMRKELRDSVPSKDEYQEEEDNAITEEDNTEESSEDD